MTIHLTRDQMKMLSPKLRRDIAFENKWRKSHQISLFIRESADSEWKRLRTLHWASEREYNKVRTEIENQQNGWQSTVYPTAQFKIVDGHSGKV